MEHDPAEGLRAATRVLNALYDKSARGIETTLTILRIFAETDEERAMPPDELARTVIEGELVRLKQKPTMRTIGGRD